MSELAVTCCIAGGGPAGIMAGYLLARAGVDVVVLEKHADFLRDFRGDTIHPSTLELMYELGLLSEFLKLPHQQVTDIGVVIGGVPIRVADFRHVPTHCKFLAFMPQWDFLDFMARQGRRYPTFKLLQEAEVESLISEDGRVTGVLAKTREGPLTVRAALTIGADGRHSDVRRLAGLTVEDFGAPMDVLWFKISQRPSDSNQSLGSVLAGRMLVMINRGEHWQCGYIIRKGGHDAVMAAGLPAFRQSIAELVPSLSDRTGELASWDDIKLLTVSINRLPVWHKTGVLCIGDAAHAMSPMGGVGINLAIQDAVATANILAEPLRAGRVGDGDLSKVQSRRMWPTRATQFAQQMAQERIISQVLKDNGPVKPPSILKLFDNVASLRRIPARLIGVGVQPEHVRSPDAFALPASDPGI